MNHSSSRLTYLFISPLCFLMLGVFCVSSFSHSATVYSDIDKQNKSYDVLEQLYSVAFQAYINEDYKKAFLNWSEASKKKHPRSQFNLGLMHERGQVPNGRSSNSAAIDFYKRSANGHYLPAYQYWARMVEKDRPELAKRIRNVYNEIASQKVVSTEKNVVFTETQAKPEPQFVNSNAASSLQREEWISEQNDRNWTIQIVAYREEVQLLEFAHQNNLSTQGAYFTEKSNDNTWYKLILGSFSTKLLADEARTNLPAAVRGEGAWLRQFKDVKAAIN